MHLLTSILSYNICTTAKIMYVSHIKTVFRIVRLRLKVIHIFIAVQYMVDPKLEFVNETYGTLSYITEGFFYILNKCNTEYEYISYMTYFEGDGCE